MDVLYKCQCSATEFSVHVRARTENEDVADWMAELTRALTHDHRRRSPFCMSTKMDYVLVPLPENAPFLGGTPKLDS